MIEDMFNNICYKTWDRKDDDVKALIKGLNAIKSTYVIQWVSKEQVRVWCDQSDFDSLIDKEDGGFNEIER